MAQITFPSDLHRRATEVIRDFFLEQPGIDSILLVNSLARGKGTPKSDIDIAVLTSPSVTNTELASLEQAWTKTLDFSSTLHKYQNSDKFAQIHLDIIDGLFAPGPLENGGAIDFFEVEIGNRLLYSLPLAGEGEYFKKLKADWLPYYGSSLREQRLLAVRSACAYDLEHIPDLVGRGLYFYAFDRLYVTFQRFLQALFIHHKKYPIAYNKWIKEQLVEILNLPELYQELVTLMSVNRLDSTELIDKANALTKLLEHHCKV